MNKICIIICYFGKLPSYFEFWRHSAYNNPTYINKSLHMRAKCAYYWQKMRLTYLSHFITRQRKIIFNRNLISKLQ